MNNSDYSLLIGRYKTKKEGAPRWILKRKTKNLIV